MKQFELLDFDFNYTEATAFYCVMDKIYVTFILTLSSDLLEIELEPDGCSTYVPYGEQMVLYDDGKGQIINVDARKAVDIDARTISLDIDNEADISDYSDSDLAEVLNISEKEIIELFKELESDVQQRCIDATSEFYLTHQDIIPEYLLSEEIDYTY